MRVEDIKSHLNKCAGKLNNFMDYEVKGRVCEGSGLIVKAKIPQASIGDICQIILSNNSGIRIAEVVALKNDNIYLMPFNGINGVSKDDEVINTRKKFSIKVSPEMIGRVLNGLGRPIDGKGDIEGTGCRTLPINNDAINPLDRVEIREIFETGIKAIDALLTCGYGQRLGIFSAAGVGKSALMAMLAQGSSADINIIALIGERGREVNEFINQRLGKNGLKKSIVIVSTSDSAALIRVKAALVAATIAEYFCSEGKKILLLMDSITRLARAQREIGLAIGEPPARYGFTPSVFELLPKIVERSGNFEKGSITSFFTILMEGNDPDEPISDEMCSLLDGHIILSRELAQQNHYPAIDVQKSISRIMNLIVSDEHKKAANTMRKIISDYNNAKDAILIGAYKNGSNKDIDYAINKINYVNEFLKQNLNERVSFQQSISNLISLFKNDF